MPAKKRKPTRARKAPAKKVTWKSEFAFLSPTSRKKVIALRFTSDGKIYLGGPVNEPQTLNPLVELPPYGGEADLRTAKITLMVEKGTALGHVAPHAWMPPRCVEYMTYQMGSLGIEKVRELGLWSVTTPGGVPIPKDLDVTFTNSGLLKASSYVASNEIDLARWTTEAASGTKASMYVALQLDRGATGYVKIVNPEKPNQPIILR